MTEVVYDLNQGWNRMAVEMLFPGRKKGTREKSDYSEKLAFFERRIRAIGGTALEQACGSNATRIRRLSGDFC